jgi:hypothetical protein
VSSSGGAPNGTVTFTVGGTTLCATGSLVSGGGSCTSSAAPAGADTVTATYSGNSSFATSSGAGALPVFENPGVYMPLNPVRVCDTRSGNGLSGDASQCNGDTLGPGGTLTFDVAGEFGVPSTNVTAVVLNVTTVDSTSAGYFTLYPAGQSLSTTSDLNFSPGQTVPNLVEVGVGTDGAISLYSAARSDAVIDLQGYVTSTPQSGEGLYNALSSPARICDTRGSNASSLSGDDTQCNTNTSQGSPDDVIGPSNPLTITVTGHGGVPSSGVSAVVLNVTVTNPHGAGYVTVFPAGQSQPTASNVNYVSGQTAANRTIVPVNGSGQATLYAAADTDLIVDVSGYYTATGGTTGSEFTPELAPVRICDTRGSNASDLSNPYTQCNPEISAGSPDDPVGPGASDTIQAVGLGFIPSGANAVVTNLTAVSSSAFTYLAMYPQGAPPATSDLNPSGGGAMANLVVVTLTSAGSFDLFNAAGRTNVALDVEGWYSS